jgi:hypothetical protein
MITEAHLLGQNENTPAGGDSFINGYTVADRFDLTESLPLLEIVF